jgi:hypothetical protein
MPSLLLHATAVSGRERYTVVEVLYIAYRMSWIDAGMIFVGCTSNNCAIYQQYLEGQYIVRDMPSCNAVDRPTKTVGPP